MLLFVGIVLLLSFTWVFVKGAFKGEGGRVKHERKLTRKMKELLSQKGLNADNWHYIKNTPEGLVIIHRHTFQTKSVNLKEA